ncbi:MAG: hypothetical protein U9Q33_09205 [Campylobacterota bacterium]|nr:hypothetical protein [Campylobacterota bacterium]
MSDELSQLDELIESEVLEALGQEVSEPSKEGNDTSTDNEIDPLDILSQELDLANETQDEDIEIPSEIVDNDDSEVKSSDQGEGDKTSNGGTIEINSANTSDLVSVLSQLLNNKTIEITIKIKD